MPFGDIDALYFFGDSFTDNGSPILAAFAPNPPYSGISFSNGPTWADVLGAQLGRPTTWGANNFAVGDAVSADLLAPTSAGQTGLGVSQIGQYLASTGGAANPNGLHSIWLGGNDFLAFAAAPGDPALLIGSILGNISAGVGTLSAFGADSFLLFNLPDISVSPLVPDPLKPSVRAIIEAYNAELLAASAQLAAALMVDVEIFDIFGLVESARPFLLDSTGTPGIDPGESALACLLTLCGPPSQHLAVPAVRPDPSDPGSPCRDWPERGGLHPRAGSAALLIAGLAGFAVRRRYI